MSPEIRRLAISWGGTHELVPQSRIDERVLEASRSGWLTAAEG